VNKTSILDLLNRHRDEIKQRFAVKRLALFGSAARDEMHQESDIDVLVGFEGPATFNGYMDLKFYLEALLGRRVDLVTEKGLRKEIRPNVERETIRVT
jgi:predicted nucleotidyltransferase